MQASCPIPFRIENLCNLRVQPLSVVENSDISPTRLTAWETRRLLASRGALPSPHLEERGSFCPFMWTCPCSSSASCSRLALLWRQDWLHLQPGSSPGAKRSTFPRLRHRPAAQTMAPPVVWPPLPRRVEGSRLRMSRPWGEVTSRRGAPKRRPTSGFACPNPPCLYFGIPEAHLHALLGDGKHGPASQIQPFRSQACRTPFSARRHSPVSRLKTPAHQVALVLAALAQGLDLSAAERVAGLSSGHHHEPFSRARARTPRRSTSAPFAPSISPPSTWRNSAPGCTVPHRSSGCGWPSIPSPRSSLCLSSVRVHHTWLTS
jgi:hypothetical protein